MIFLKLAITEHTKYKLCLLCSHFRHIPFEIAIGMNGGVWVRAEGIKDTVVIRNALLNAQSLDDAHTEAMVEKLVAMAKR